LTAAILSSAVFTVPYAALSTFLPVYSSLVFGIPTALAFTSFIPLYVVSLLVRSYMATTRFQGLAVPVFASIAITFSGIVIMYLAPSYVVLLAVMALLGIPHGMTFTLGLYMVARTSAIDERNASNSFYSSHYGVANVLVPLAMGYLAILVGIHVAFLILLVPSALLAVSFLAFFRDSLGPPDVTGAAI
jgi:hypothetical protein